MDRYKYLDTDEQSYLYHEIADNAQVTQGDYRGIRKTIEYLNKHGLLNLSEIRTICCNKKYHLNGIGMFRCSDFRGHSGNHRCVVERIREGDVIIEWPQQNEV